NSLFTVGWDPLKSSYENSPYSIYHRKRPLRDRYDYSRPLGSGSYSVIGGGEKDESDSLDNLATLATQVLLGKNLKVVETCESRIPTTQMSKYPEDDYNIE